MTIESKRGGSRTGAGRPKKAERIKKQLFLNTEIVEKIKDLSADEVNKLLGDALRPNVETLNGLDVSHKIGEIEVTYKPNKLSETVINGSSSAYEILKDVWSDKLEWIEEFVLLLLNNQNQPLGYVKLFQGGMNVAIVDTRVVFQIALVGSASGIIVCHNHPSGNLTPSEADKKITQNLSYLGKALGVPLIDHIIITSSGYYSFKDNGLIY